MSADTPSHAIDPFTFRAEVFESASHKKPITLNQSTLDASTPAMKRVSEPGGKSSPSSITPAQGAKKPVPKTPFPPALIPEFLSAIEGSEKSQEHLIHELIDRFSGRKDVTIVAIRYTFSKVASREKKGTGRWNVINNALVSVFERDQLNTAKT